MDRFLLPLSLLSLSLPALAHAAKPSVSCTAVYRTLDEKNDTVERTAELPAKILPGGKLQHEVALHGKVFRLTEDHGDLFAQIITPAPLAQGVTARGNPDAQGRFTLAEVVGFTVYRLECSRR